MKRIFAVITFIACSFTFPAALACSEPDVPTFRQSLDSANQVFVFRLLSLELTDMTQSSRDMTGRLEIVRTLKGRPQFQRLRHDAVRCGGLRLVVGNYYLVATSRTGQVLTLVRGDRSIADISSDYVRFIPPRNPDQLWQTQIANYLAGRPLRRNFDPTEITDPVQAFPTNPSEIW